MRFLGWMGSVLIALCLYVGSTSNARAEYFTSGYFTCNRAVITSEGQTWVEPWKCWYNAPPSGNLYTDGPSNYDQQEQIYACRYLRLHRPANCPEEVPMPVSADYGALTAYQNGSGLAKLISLSKSSLTVPGINEQLTDALATHTVALASRAFQASDVNKALISSVQAICEEQGERALPGAYGTLYCFQALDRLIAENGDGGALSYFQNWITVNHADFGIDIFSLSSLIAWLQPDNSLAAKYNLVTSDAACAEWWDSARLDGCVM